jgi:hypothetical protein
MPKFSARLDDVVFTVSGDSKAHNISELTTLWPQKEGGRTHVLDLRTWSQTAMPFVS